MYLRAQLVSLRRFKRRARAIRDVHCRRPLFAIGPDRLAFDPETHEFWQIIACKCCSAVVNRTVRRRSDLGMEELVVCCDCARLPLEGAPRDDAFTASVVPASVVPASVVPAPDRPLAVLDGSLPSPTQNGHAARSRETADEEPAREVSPWLVEAMERASSVRTDPARTREAAEEKLARGCPDGRDPKARSIQGHDVAHVVAGPEEQLGAEAGPISSR